MKKFLSMLLTVAFVMSVLSIPANAVLEKAQEPDVIISKITDGSSLAFFPDIAKLPNGKLVVAYYRNTVHVPTNLTHVKNATIEWTESTDNGLSWSVPRTFIDQEKLIEWRISTETDPVHARDPNFAVLSDGTLVLTFFTAQFGGTNHSKVYITTSRDGGITWKVPEVVPCDSFNFWYAKRGDIGIYNDGYMLIPVYGKAVGDDRESAVNILVHYSHKNGWDWENRKEYKLLNTTGTETLNEVSLVVSADGGTTYAFAREPGKVWESSDRGATWTQIADEGKDTDLVHQPGLKLLPDGSIFATWSKKGSAGRPVYAKRFYPELGWDATESTIVYAPITNSSDMGDPSGILLDNGKLLVIYYDYHIQSIGGTFLEMSDLAVPTESRLVMPEVVYAVKDIPMQISARLVPKKDSATTSWSSSNTSIVTVADGVITPVKTGEAIITAICEDATAQTKVIVTEAACFSENFNSLTVNNHPAGWSHNGASIDTCHARVYMDGTEKVLRVLDRSSDIAPINVIKQFTTADTVVASFDYKMINAGYSGKDNSPEGANSFGLLYNGLNISVDARVALYVKENKDGIGTLYYYDTSDGGGGTVATSITNIRKDTWYNVKIEMISGSDTVKVTFGEETVNIPVLGLRTHANILWFASNSKATKNDEFMIDNVVVKTNVLPTTYNITFDAGNEITGFVPTKAPTVPGETFMLPGSTFAKERYKFYGWLCGSKIYKAGEMFTMPAEDVKFTAYWQFDVYDGTKSETFKDMTVEQTPTGWTGNGVDNENCYMRVYDDGGNNVLRIYDNASSTANILWSFPKAKTLRVDFKFKTFGMNQYGNGIGIMKNTFTHDTVTLRIVPENNGTTGKLTYYNGNNSVETGITGIKKNEWYDVSIEIIEGASQAKIIFGDKVTNVDLINGAGSECAYFWAGSAGGSSTGDDYMIDDVSIYTKTKYDKFRVTYLGGLNASGTAPVQDDTEENSTFTLPENPFTRGGYKFAGWVFKNKIYKAGSSFKMPAKNVEFTAHWELASFTSTVTEDFTSKTAGEIPYGWRHNGVDTEVCHARVYNDNGNNLLHVLDNGPSAPNVLWGFTEAKTVRLDFKFKTLGMNAGGNGIALANNASFQHDGLTLRVVPDDDGKTGKVMYYKNTSQETGITGIEIGKWYDVSVEMIEGSDEVTVIFGDKIGTAKLINGVNSSVSYFWACTAGGAPTGDEYMIDDIKISTKIKQTVSITSSTIPDGAENVIAPVKFLYFETEDELLANTVTKDKIIINGATIKTVELVKANRVKVTLDGIFPSSTYTLLVDGIETVLGDSLKDTITFATQMIKNSYEYYFEDNTIPTQIAGLSTMIPVLTTEKAYNGSQSIKVSSVDQYGGYLKMWVNNLERNTTYLASFYIYSANWTEQNSNNPIFEDHGIVIGKHVVEETDKPGWRKVTAIYNSSASGAALINLWGMGSDTIYFDDIEFKKLTNETVCAPAMFNSDKIVNGIMEGTTTIELPIKGSTSAKNVVAYVVQYDSYNRMINFAPATKTISANTDDVITLTLTNGKVAKAKIIIMDATTFAPLCDVIEY